MVEVASLVGGRECLPLGGGESELFAHRPKAAAGRMARADLSQARQRSLTEQYFLDPARTAAERDHFLAMVPNVDLTMSYNLLSEPPKPYPFEEVVARLRGARETLREWLGDPRFRAWSEEIRSAYQRVGAHLAPIEGS